MEDLLARMFHNLAGRLHGPLQLRLILQPVVATILGIKGGIGDARAGRPVYFWSILTNAEHRRDLLRDGWKAVTTVFILAIVLDVVYQLIALKWVYPGEALIVAFILAFVPYLLIRGPANRIARLFQRDTK